MSDYTLLKNHPHPELIPWKFLDKETYLEMEHILTDGVVFFEPFLIDNFYDEEDFEELKQIVESYELTKLNYTYQMNKWEERLPLPQKFIDIAIEKVKKAVGTDDMVLACHMYAHHQRTEDGRFPKLPLHIDKSPGSYMIDIHIGGNRDWEFGASFSGFNTKPNQAVVCQPEHEWHWRPDWNSENPNDTYKILMIHLRNKNHWSVPSDFTMQNRPLELNAKYPFGVEFQKSKVYSDYFMQKISMYESFYKSRWSAEKKLGKYLPNLPSQKVPDPEEMKITRLKNVKPAE
jgi:hypothetical protein